jgi:hypothetical protein
MANYPLVRAPKPALVWPACCALLLWAASFSPALFVMLVFVSPVLLALCGSKAGLVPMAACAAMIPAASWLIFHVPNAPILCGIYLWPFLVLNAYCFSREIPFFKAVAAQAGLIALCETGVLMILRSMAGGDLFTGGAEFLVDQVSNSPFGDQLLLQLYQYGLLSVPQEMLTGARALVDAVFSTITADPLGPTMRTELLNGLRTLLENYLYGFIPSILVTNAVLAGLLSLAIPIHAGRKQKLPDLHMPALSSWHLDRSTGIKVLVLALGNALPYLFPNPGILLAGNMMGAAFATVFQVQGVALMSFFQERSGSRPFFRWLWPCVLFLFIPTLLLLMGVADQFLNIRGLRNSKDKEDI